MAICLSCNHESKNVGELCPACKKCYTVQNNPGTDSMNMLGKLIANKFIPTSVLSESNETIYYDAFQPAVARQVTLILFKPSTLANEKARLKFQSFIDKSSSVKQQNALSLLEIVELPEIHSYVIAYEATKGETLDKYLQTQSLDPVAYMHIIHQILQVVAAHHAKGICFPHLSPENVRILSSGSDIYFVKLTGILASIFSHLNEPESTQDDVYYIGQIALYLITGNPLPITIVELPPDKSFLMPIAQLFMRTLAPKDQRFESCVDLLQAFEIAFSLNASHEQDPQPPVSTKSSSSKRAIPKHTPIPFEQIIWMHRPPEAM